MNKLIMIAMLSAAAVTLTGCMTEKSRLITEGETAEVTSGFSEDEIRAFTRDVVQKINAASARYAIPGKRRIVNVKNFKIDTLSRGNDAAYLSETIAQCLKEELLNGGMFIVYNERVGAAGTVQPEFVLDAKLLQRNGKRCSFADTLNGKALIHITAANLFFVCRKQAEPKLIGVNLS